MEILKFGMEGYGVKLLQYALGRAGMEPGNLDGIYGRLLRRTSGTSFTAIIGKDVLAEETIRDLAACVERAADRWLAE